MYFLCYNRCVNTGRILMANQFMRYARAAVFPVLALGGSSLFSSCGSTKDDPTPKPVDPSQYKEVHVNVVQNITMNRSNSNFQGTAFYNEDKSIGNGLDAVAYSTDNSRVSTTTWSANSENIRFTVNFKKENITQGNLSVKDGEYYLAAKAPQDPIIVYNSVDNADLKVVQDINTVEKIKTFKHVKQINLYAPGAIDGGIRIRGSQFANNEAYLKYIENCADTQSTKGFASRRYLDILPSANPSYAIIP